MQSRFSRKFDPSRALKMSDYSTVEQLQEAIAMQREKNGKISLDDVVIEVDFPRNHREKLLEDYLIEFGGDCKFTTSYTCPNYFGKYDIAPASHRSFVKAKQFLREVGEKLNGLDDPIAKGLTIHMAVANQFIYQTVMNPATCPTDISENEKSGIMGFMLNPYSSIADGDGTCVPMSYAVKMLGDMCGIHVDIIDVREGDPHIGARLHANGAIIEFSTEDDTQKVKFGLPLAGFTTTNREAKRQINSLLKQWKYPNSNEILKSTITPVALGDRLQAVFELQNSFGIRMSLKEVLFLLQECNDVAKKCRERELKNRHFSMVLGRSLIHGERRNALIVKVEGRDEYCFITESNGVLQFYHADNAEKSFTHTAKEMKDNIAASNFRIAGKTEEKQKNRFPALFTLPHHR